MFKVKGTAGKTALDRWCSWATRCRIPAFVELARRIKRHRTEIDAARFLIGGGQEDQRAAVGLHAHRYHLRPVQPE